MKIVVFSDAHGNQAAVDRILGYHPDADYVVSLGDSLLPHEYLLERDIVHVKGNIGRDPGFAFDTSIHVQGVSMFITHGHQYKVHRTLDKLVKHAVANHHQVALYGHTHVAHITRLNHVIVINPGSCDSPRNTLPPTYLILDIVDGIIQATFKDVFTNRTIEW